MAVTCRCGCSVPQDGGAHPIVAALAADDLDTAMQAGLLTIQACPGCTPACQAMLLAARDARRFALAARDRFRAREARLTRRQEERRRRATPASSAEPGGSPATPALPPAAAAALARAMDKAAGRRSP